MFLLPIWALLAAHPLTAAPSAVLAVVSALRLQQLPLIGGQLAAKRQKEARICLLQLSPSLGYLVNLGKNLGLIRLILPHQWLHGELGLLHIGAQARMTLKDWAEAEGVSVNAIVVSVLEEFFKHLKKSKALREELRRKLLGSSGFMPR